MSFVIDDPDTLRMLQELADLTGETMEEAAIVSVEQKRQILRGEKTSEQVATEDWQRVLAHWRRQKGTASELEPTSPDERSS